MYLICNEGADSTVLTGRCECSASLMNPSLESMAERYHDDAINHQAAVDPISGKADILEMFKREFAQAVSGVWFFFFLKQKIPK